MNYYQKFLEQIESLTNVKKTDKNTKPTLLLHACCAPCSSHVLSVVAEHFDVTVFFYNPNIDDEAEYKKRLDELVRFTGEADFARDVKVADGGYGPEEFFKMAKGRENLPEGNERCYDCYKLRLKKTAEYALMHGFDFFTTTLSISPYKRSDWINEIGTSLEREMREEICGQCGSVTGLAAQGGSDDVSGLAAQGESDDVSGFAAQDESDDVSGLAAQGDKDGLSGENGAGRIPEFLFSDFKKKNGYKHSIELSGEYSLYRQDYCGCIFSKVERDKKLKEKEAAEVASCEL